MLRVLAIGLAAVLMSPAPVHAQETPQKEQGLKQKLDAFMARPDVKRRQVSAENGDPYSMVWLSDEIGKALGGELFGLKTILPFQVKYLMGAIEQNYAPAFRRMGDIVRDGRTPEGTAMDAARFYEGGAKLGDFDAAYQYYKLAISEKVCSGCTLDKYGVTFERPFNAEEKKRTENMNVLTAEYQTVVVGASERAAQAYVNEKASMVRAALGYLDTPALQDNWNAQSLVARAYLYGIQGADLVKLRFGTLEKSDVRKVIMPEPAKARPIFERFAAKGDARAINWLSKLHLTGQLDGFEQSKELFLKYTGQLAAKGNPDAAQMIGNVMLTGKPFGTDYDIAATYLYQAYEAGHAEAAGDLGYMFLSGSGVPKDEATALRLFTEGANRGSSKSADMVSQMHRDGVGGGVNNFLAKVYAKKAEDNRAAEAKTKALMDQIGL